MMNYTTQQLQFHHHLSSHTDDQKTDEPVEENKLTNALIHLLEPNQPTHSGHSKPPMRNTTHINEETSLLDETIFANVLISSVGHPPYVPLSTNLGLKYKRRMLYFPLDCGELTIDGLVDTGALTSAIPESDFRKIKMLTPQLIKKESSPLNFYIMVANGQLETPNATVELKFEAADIEFHEIFIVMDNLTGPIIGLMFLQRNHTVLNMRQKKLNFTYFSMQLKTADHKNSNVMELILNPCDITIPLNDRVTIQTQSQVYSEHNVAGILQSSDTLHEEGDVTFCPGIITMTKGNTKVHIINFTDQPFCIKKGFHIANFSVLTPEQLRNIQLVDPVTLWHLLQENEDNAIQYVSSLLKTHRYSEDMEKYWFNTPENTGEQTTHTPIQKRILSELHNLQELNPLENEQSRQQFFKHFDWKDSMLNRQEFAEVKNLLVEFHDIFARHRFDIGMNEEFTVKLLPKDDSPAYSQSLPTPVKHKDDILVELAHYYTNKE